MTKINIKIFINIIKLYRLFISPFFSPSCRYLPTCSEYAIEALEKFGVIKGTFKIIKRVATCHPIKFLGGGEGYDPVMKNSKVKK